MNGELGFTGRPGVRSQSSGIDVFRLDRKLTTDISRSIAGGWLAFVRSDGQDLIAFGPGAADYETAVEDAISAAQEALDLIAAEGGPALTIEGAVCSRLINGAGIADPPGGLPDPSG